MIRKKGSKLKNYVKWSVFSQTLDFQKLKLHLEHANGKLSVINKKFMLYEKTPFFLFIGILHQFMI